MLCRCKLQRLRHTFISLLILGSIALSFAQSDAFALDSKNASPQVINLQGDRILSTLPDVFMSNKELVITGNGPYLLLGELEDLCLHIKSSGETVLILENVTIRNSLDEAIVSEESCSLRLIAEKGTENILTAGKDGYLIPDKEAKGAALHAKGPLEICGEGSLQINGFINNGIRCNDRFLISDNVKMEIRASNRAIRAADCIMKDGEARLLSGETNIYTENSLVIQGGCLEAETSDHCIRSDGDIQIEGGAIHLKSSEKRGMTASETVSISGGEITMETYGDGIFSEAGVLISDGDISIFAGEDGLQVGGRREYTELPIQLNGGAVKITAGEDPIDVLDGYAVNGGKLLAVGRSESSTKAANGVKQQVYYKSVKGKKREEILLRVGKESMLQITSAYVYDTVIYSLPGKVKQKNIELLIR